MYAGWVWPAEGSAESLNRKGAQSGVVSTLAELCRAATRLLQVGPNHFVLFLWICSLPDELYATK